MHYVLHCLDKPQSLEVRKANRDQHLAHLETVRDQILVAGPLLDEEGGMIGSLLIIDFADRAAAEAFAAADPYAQAGLFQSVSITGYRKVLP